MMHQYITNNSRPQPPATVKQMAPVPETIDPKLLEQAARELQLQQQAPMSSQDGVSITITVQPNKEIYAENYQDAYSKHGDIFSASQLGQAVGNPMELSPDPEARGNYVKRRSQDILSQVLNSARRPMY